MVTLPQHDGTAVKVLTMSASIIKSLVLRVMVLNTIVKMFMESK